MFKFKYKISVRQRSINFFLRIEFNLGAKYEAYNFSSISCGFAIGHTRRLRVNKSYAPFNINNYSDK